MLISTKTTARLCERLGVERELYCDGLYLSARWFVLAQAARSGVHLVVLPDREAAEYCAADLYHLTEGDEVFFLPPTGKGVERSNYKSSLNVQRTAAISRLLDSKAARSIVVSWPEALEERIPSGKNLRASVLSLTVGEEISFDRITSILQEEGFERSDFVSAPGQYAVRGSIIDIFSYANNEPYRLSFWGNELESIHIFDCNMQISKEKTDRMEVVSSLFSDTCSDGDEIFSLLPADTVVWLDGSDLYKEHPLFESCSRFRRVFLEIPVSGRPEEPLRFSISPQPSFNKNIELLEADIRTRLEQGFRVCVFGEKEAQLERLRSILAQEGGLMPEFIKGKNLHNGFVDAEDKICCYSDHEVFDRFHRVRIRRSVEKSEQLTINDLTTGSVRKKMLILKRIIWDLHLGKILLMEKF